METVANRNAEPLIRQRSEFENHGDTFHGTNRPGRAWHSRMNTETREAYERDYDAAHGRMYVVYSYATPIAWYSTERGWVVPDVRYSTATGRHQRVVRSAVLAEEVANV